ncbi:MAG: dephospho-CoA kinase [Clostridia bacterium]|nr:dephospho-CoA kinase [Clostridia bacterium]
MQKNKLIALTGGIGSGKSLALATLKDAGYNTLSCDAITSDLYEKRKIKLILKKMFPTAVKGFFNPIIDRKEISKIAFNDKVKHAELTDTITPFVMQEVLRRASKIGGMVFVEVPLLFECGYQDEFDGVMVITRPKHERVKSVMARSNLTEEQVLARIKNQTDYDNFDLSKYMVIENTGNQTALKEKILNIAKDLD